MPTPLIIDSLPDGALCDAGAADGARMVPVKTYLSVIEGLSPQDMIVAAEDRPPMLEGMEEESLACPACQIDVTSGVSTSTLHALFQPPGRLIFHCNCGAHAEIPPPSTAGAS